MQFTKLSLFTHAVKNDSQAKVQILGVWQKQKLRLRDATEDNSVGLLNSRRSLGSNWEFDLKMKLLF